MSAFFSHEIVFTTLFDISIVIKHLFSREVTGDVIKKISIHYPSSA